MRIALDDRFLVNKQHKKGTCSRPVHFLIDPLQGIRVKLRVLYNNKPFSYVEQTRRKRIANKGNELR